MDTDMSPKSAQFQHITGTPGFMGGEPCVDGLRIRVRDIVAARDLGGYSPEQIADSVFPVLSLPQVQAALAYYEAHRSEIDQARQDEAKFVEEFLKQHPHLVRDLRSLSGPPLPLVEDQLIRDPLA
jgi:uncharacterized protein (DUF433 family)